MKQEAEKSENILLDGEILHWLRTNFSTWLFGWPNLACHRLIVLGVEIIELEAITEFLVTVGDVIEVEMEVDSSWGEWSWNLMLWNE